MDGAVEAYQEYIKSQVLANNLVITAEPISDATSLDFEDFTLAVKVEKI